MNKLSGIRNRAHQSIHKHPYLFYALALLILCTFEIRLITLIYTNNIEAGAAAAKGILEGTPHWRVTQNRLLGPAAVGLISHITGLRFSTSNRIAIWSLLILTNFLSFILFLDLTKDKKQALGYSFLFAVLFIFFQNREWLYIWDFIDLIIFLLFAYGIFNKIKLHYLVILFCVGLLNRESALYIGLWILMDSFHFNNRMPAHFADVIRGANVNYWKLALGSLLIVGGMIYTKWIRDALFVQSMLPGVGSDMEHAFWGQHFQTLPNLHALARITIHFQYVEFIAPIIVFILPLYLVYKMKVNELSIKVMVLFLFMLITIFAFGRITETRIFCILIPFALVLNLYFDDRMVLSHRDE